MSLLKNYNPTSDDEAEFLVIIAKLTKMSAVVTEALSLGSSMYTPETNLCASIDEAIFLLDSTYSSGYAGTSYQSSNSFYAGRTVSGKLQRITSTIETLDNLLISLKGER